MPQLQANKWITCRLQHPQPSRMSSTTQDPKRINRLTAKNPKSLRLRRAGPLTHRQRTAVANLKTARIITCRISYTHPPRPACLNIRVALVTSIRSRPRPSHPSKASKTRKVANSSRPPSSKNWNNAKLAKSKRWPSSRTTYTD